MKKRMIWLAGCLVALAACDESKYDLDQLTPQEYYKILYVKDGGEQALSLYDTTEDYVYTFSVVKGGALPELSANADVKVLNQTELDAEYGTGYTLLSSNMYSIDVTHIELTADKPYQQVNVAFKPQAIKALMEDDADLKLVLPLQVVSETDSINANLNDAFLAIEDVVMPTVGFASTTLSLDSYDYASLPAAISKEIPFKLDLDNMWDITCGFDVDADYMDTYNTNNYAGYRLLPEGSYELPETVELPSGTTTTNVVVNIDGSQLAPGDYMLPVRLSSVSEFEISSTSNVYPLCIRVLAPQLDRTGWTATASSEERTGEGSNGALVLTLDGNTGTYWHSEWQSGTGVLPYELDFDPQEEYTITHVAMRNRSGYTDVDWGYFYVSDDQENWTEVGTFKMQKDGSTQMFAVKTPTQGRYFRVEIKASNRETHCALSEVYFYGM